MHDYASRRGKRAYLDIVLGIVSSHQMGQVAELCKSQNQSRTISLVHHTHSCWSPRSRGVRVSSLLTQVQVLHSWDSLERAALYYWLALVLDTVPIRKTKLVIFIFSQIPMVNDDTFSCKLLFSVEIHKVFPSAPPFSVYQTLL